MIRTVRNDTHAKDYVLFDAICELLGVFFKYGPYNDAEFSVAGQIY